MKNKISIDFPTQKGLYMYIGTSTLVLYIQLAVLVLERYTLLNNTIIK